MSRKLQFELVRPTARRRAVELLARSGSGLTQAIDSRDVFDVLVELLTAEGLVAEFIRHDPTRTVVYDMTEACCAVEQGIEVFPLEEDDAEEA